MTKRIWELDALRGLCILAMVAVHLVYDLRIPTSALFDHIQRWGGVAFVLLSGVCVTLGSHPVKRGLVVLGCGLVCTAVTGGMHLLGLADKGLVIWFGVLHCLGVCMLLWPLLGRLRSPVLAVLGLVLAAAGLYLDRVTPVDFPWLVPLGILYPGFVTSDYFPLMPNLGFFLLGAVLGRALYRSKRSLLPNVRQSLPIRFACRCGQLTLPIYLLHQPILWAVLELLT